MPNFPVAYLGPTGTFSHLVALKRFGPKADLRPFQSVGAVFHFLEDDVAARAVVPVENSSGGTIYDTVDLLIENAGRLFVIEQIALDVDLALLGRPGEPIRKIFSHFVPLRHFREWIGTNLPQAEPAPVASTAVAAEMASRTPGAAALSARGAAELYGLEVLQFPISKDRANVTQFFVLASKPVQLRAGSRARTAVAVSFGNVAGSLYRFLAPFARWKININRIVSRPFAGRPEQSVFFMEIDGSPGQENFDRAIARAQARSEWFVNFGSFGHAKRFRS